MKWRSFKDDPPPDSERVLLFWADLNRIELGDVQRSRNTGYEWIRDYRGTEFCLGARPSHWMPLPSAPDALLPYDRSYTGAELGWPFEG